MMAKGLVKFTGEPDAVKVARPVRRGTVGKVPLFGNSLAVYPTASEFDGRDIFFGLVIGFEAEFGYFSLSELESVRGPLGLPIERDQHFRPRALVELRDHYRREGFAL